MTWQWILAGLVLSVIVVTAVLFVVRRAWVVRVSNATIIVQAGLVLTAWLLIATMPEKRDFSGGVGDTCPDLRHAAGDCALDRRGGLARDSRHLGDVGGRERRPPCRSCRPAPGRTGHGGSLPPDLGAADLGGLLRLQLTTRRASFRLTARAASRRTGRSPVAAANAGSGR